MKRIFKENGLSIVLFALFFLTLAGQYFTGYEEYNEDRKTHGKPAVSYTEYLGEGHFIEATFENWESEFLQMGMFVILTVFLYQKGSAESKDPDKVERVDLIPERARRDQDSPAAARRSCRKALRKFAQSGFSFSVSAFVCVARRRRREDLQSGTSRTQSTAGFNGRTPRNFAFLV